MRSLPAHLSRLSPLGFAALCLMASVAQAQSSTEASLPDVTVNAPKEREARASIGGFGQEPAWQAPLQAKRFSSEALKDAQVKVLADITKLDASISDAYNAAGYWDVMAVRGFTLDSAYNLRREGLPINNETSIPLDNKAGVEVLKGTSGIQAGTSSPGGLINYLVKRPTGTLRTAELSVDQHGDVLTAVDLSERFGATQAHGLRINAANERLNTAIDNTKGNRQLLALATDWRVQQGTLLEFEIEYSRRSQPSVPGFSMLGSTLPPASSIDLNRNLNKQSWAAPVVLQGTTGSLRLTQELGGGWKAVGSYGEQRLRSDDSAAFPYGCSNGDGYLADRYCADGSFDLYDYRSLGEVRVTRALDVNVSGEVRTAGIRHELTTGLTRSLSRVDVPTSNYDYVGAGSVYSDVDNPATNLAPTSAQNDKQSRNTELYLRDSLRLSEAWRAWLGLRHTQLSRTQSLSDGSQPAARSSQSFTTPWVAVGYEWAPRQQVYASWGEGVEVLPARFSGPYTTYTNNGEILPAAKSRQWEVGVKGQLAQTDWSVNWFHVVRPEAASITHDDDSKTYQRDGDSRHQGLEAQLATRIGAWGLNASAMVLDAERRHSANSAVNGKAPANVPDYSVKLGNSYRVAALPGLTLLGDVVHEGPRTADVANGVRIPAWTRLDAGLSLAQRLGANAVTWRLGITNLLDTKAWRESPNQFDHIYLIPLAGRTVTASAIWSF